MGTGRNGIVNGTNGEDAHTGSMNGCFFFTGNYLVNRPSNHGFCGFGKKKMTMGYNGGKRM